MSPGLLEGDWLLVLPSRRSSPGSVVVVRDPRAPARLLIKRVRAVAGRALHVAGDLPDASTDSRAFGAVDASTVVGRAVFRYAPLRRIGRVR